MTKAGGSSMKKCFGVLMKVLFFYGILFTWEDFACADSGGLSVSADFTPLGLSAAITSPLAPRLSARLGMHAADSGFQLSGGLVWDNNSAETVGRQKGGAPFVSHDTVRSSVQAETRKPKVDIDGFAPFAGIGWGNPFGKEKRWGLILCLGFVYEDPLDPALSVGLRPVSSPIFPSDPANERDLLEEARADADFYPVIAVGITHKF
jgi:hypothetical protein